MTIIYVCNDVVSWRRSALLFSCAWYKLMLSCLIQGVRPEMSPSRSAIWSYRYNLIQGFKECDRKCRPQGVRYDHIDTIWFKDSRSATGNVCTIFTKNYNIDTHSIMPFVRTSNINTVCEIYFNLLYYCKVMSKRLGWISHTTTNDIVDGDITLQ
jgi:hypothetical protein